MTTCCSYCGLTCLWADLLAAKLVAVVDTQLYGPSLQAIFKYLDFGRGAQLRYQRIQLLSGQISL
jgi:hypothetical protein